MRNRLANGRASSTGTWRATLDAVASATTIIVGVIVAATIVASYLSRTDRGVTTSPSLPLPNTPLGLTGAARRGDPTAKVALMEFADFQCPFCRRFALETLPALEREFIDAGRVQFLFRQLPLPVHAGARPAAEAAVCATQQGRFWDAHDAFFKTSDPGEVAKVLASQLGLNELNFQACAKASAKVLVDDDVASAKLVKVRVTPSFVIGTIDAEGRLKALATIAGARPLRDFEVALNDAITRAGG